MVPGNMPRSFSVGCRERRQVNGKAIDISSDELVTPVQRNKRIGIKPTTAALLSDLFLCSSDDKSDQI